MEHRYASRHPDHFDITLSNPRYGTATAQVQNVSSEGMALRLDGVRFPQGTLLDVVLPESRQALFHTCSLKGYVVYANQEQTGIWLLEPSAADTE